MSRVLLVVPFVLAAITTLFATTLTALAANTTCAGIWGSNTYPGTVTNIKGNVVVPDGASCTLCFAKVSGNVQSAIGVNFNATTYQVVGNYIPGAFVNAQATRSRPLCPYQQEFTGSTTLLNGLTGGGRSGGAGQRVERRVYRTAVRSLMAVDDQLQLLSSRIYA